MSTNEEAIEAVTQQLQRDLIIDPTKVYAIGFVLNGIGAPIVTHIECPSCGFDAIIPATVTRDIDCPDCGEGKGVEVLMQRTDKMPDKVEGRDARKDRRPGT